MEGADIAGPIRARRTRRRRNRGPAGGPLQGNSSENGGMIWFRRDRPRKRRVKNELENANASEGGLPGDDREGDDSPRELPDLQYTKEMLLELRSHPLSNKRPDCLNDPFNEAIERWHGDKKRSETPPEDDSRRRLDSSGNTDKRRSNDPRERVRKEQDGIVLSPQRRSFNSGCFVPNSHPPPSVGSGRRPESPIGKGESNLILGRDLGHRELTTTRRIGSGRIPARESSWEFREPSWEMREAVWDQLDENLAPEHGSFRPGGGSGPGAMGRGGDRERDTDSRHDNRRRFGFDFERERDRERDRDLDKDRYDRRNEKGRGERHDRMDERMGDRMSDRGNDRMSERLNDRMNDRMMRRPERDDRDRDRYGRRRNDSREEEPEWFSAGPTSQHDTIELRGFEDIPEDGQPGGRGKKNSKSAKTNARTANPVRKSSDSSSSTTRTSSSSPADVPKKTCQDGKVEKTEKVDQGGPPTRPLATSSPDVKDKVKQNQENVSKNEVGLEKERMEVLEDSQSDNRRKSPVPNEKSNASSHLDFNLDEFLKIDSLPLLMNGEQTEAPVGGSRFRQWFSRDSPTKDEGLSSVPEAITNMLNDITEPTISIPGSSELESFFAPISPAASSLHQQQHQQHEHQARASHTSSHKTSLSLLEMLQRGSASGPPHIVAPVAGEIPSIRDLEASGKLHSVEELEARIRTKRGDIGGAVPPVREPRLADPAIAGVVHHGGLPPPMTHQREDEVAAFKKLLAKVSGGSGTSTSVPASLFEFTKAQHSDFIQMLKQSHEPQIGTDAPISTNSNNAIMNAFTGLGQATLASVHPVTGQPQQTQQQMQIPEDLLMKLLHVQQQQHQQQQQHRQQQQQQQQQQDMLSKLMNNARMSQQQMQPHHHLHPQQQGRRIGQIQQPNQFSGVQSSRSPLPPEVQSLIANAPLNHDLLQRAEAQAIITGLNQGELTMQHLVQQLQNPAITRRHQELLLSILKSHSQKSSTVFYRPTVISPNLPSAPSNLTFQPLHPVQRVPSPREMAIHSQSMMQSALIKKKLEEQKENYRKRHEQHRSLSPNVSAAYNNNAVNKNETKHPISSPTPLAFTPTSVLKKMNAEKEGDQKIGGMPGGLPLGDVHQMPQGSRQPAMQLSSPQPPPSQHRLLPNWNANKAQSHPQGRAIVKSSNNFSYSGPDSYLSQPSIPPQSQQIPPHLRGPPPQPPAPYAARSKMTMNTPPPNLSQQPPQYNMSMMPPCSPQTSNPRGQHLPSHLNTMQNSPNLQHSATSSLQQMLMGSNYQQNRKTSMPHGGSGDLSTSPTSNQLARWFSPELLARARSGPSIPAQGMLSVEDIERLQQAVHN